MKNMIKPFVKTRKLTGKDANKVIDIIKKNILSSSQEQKMFYIATFLIRKQHKKPASLKTSQKKIYVKGRG